MTIHTMLKEMISLKLVYLANVVVAGWIGISSLFFPQTAIRTVFSNAYEPSGAVQLVGALWLAIAILSLIGLWRPLSFSPILIFQLIYKGGWLLAVAIPAIMNGLKYPKGMAVFFVVWVIALPFVIPWKHLFG